MKDKIRIQGRKILLFNILTFNTGIGLKHGKLYIKKIKLDESDDHLIYEYKFNLKSEDIEYFYNFINEDFGYRTNFSGHPCHWASRIKFKYKSLIFSLYAPDDSEWWYNGKKSRVSFSIFIDDFDGYLRYEKKAEHERMQKEIDEYIFQNYNY